MLGADTRLLGDAAALAALHAAELPQKDELCGAFCTLLALRAAGFELDQDAVALAAGTTLSATGHREALPAGETGRRDYRAELPVIEDEARSGTAAGGLVRAASELSGGRREAVPVAGPWSAEAVDALLEAALAEPEAALVLNVGTGFWWGSHPTAAQLLAYLEHGDPGVGPPPDWDVGHFVSCYGQLRGRAGTLLIIADTYPTLGLGAVHLQPRERVAAALVREGMTPGGALVIVPAERAAAVRARLEAAGVELRAWDNGSLDARASASS